MRFKEFLALMVLFSVHPAWAVMLVNQPALYPQKEISGTTSGPFDLYFAASKDYTPASGGVLSAGVFVNTNKGYRVIDTNSGSSADYIWIDVSTNKAFTLASGEKLVVALLAGTEGTTAVPLLGAEVMSVNSAPSACNNCIGGSSGRASAIYTPNTVIRLSFSLADLCSVGSHDDDLCTGYSTFDGSTVATVLSKTMHAVIGIMTTSGAIPGTSGTVDSTEFTLNLTKATPAVTATSCPQALADPSFYFPGDGEIILNASNYGASDGAGNVPLQYLVFFGEKIVASGAPTPIPVDGSDAPFTDNNIVAYLDSAEGSPHITGFDNTTTGNDNLYQGIVYAQNRAGIFSPTCYGSDSINKIRSQPISGVLAESKCFIATAAYHSGTVFPVMLLRQFRDQVLSQSQFGKAFIHFYYQNSPSLALWAWDKPWVRMIALKVLTPIEIVAFVILHPIIGFSFLLMLFSGVFMIIFGLRQLRVLLFLVFFIFSPFLFYSVQAFSEESNSPYIDKLKQEMGTETAEKGSYSETLKKKLLNPSEVTKPTPAPNVNGSYIESTKNELKSNEAENSSASENPNASYTEQEKLKLPKEDQESIIANVKAGKTALRESERPPIRNAIALKVGVSPGMSLSAKGSSHTLDEMYGTGFKPDVWIHYERQLFHDENFGSFGPTFDTGISYLGAPGLLKYSFAGSFLSRTNFSLIQVPVLLGALYRFNLLRILRPYGGANIGVIGVTEIRNDSNKDKRDVSFVYSATGGVCLLLDFLDPRSMRQAYDESGYQHIYLFAEYIYLNTLSGNVDFGRSGIYSGFMFEI